MPDAIYTLQDSLYEFPYHYLPRLEAGGIPRLHRELNWGLEYLTYLEFLSELIRSQGPSSLLDVGCGDGRLIHLVKRFVPRVSGVDVSERAAGFARAFNPDVPIACGDVATISERYAAVTLVEVLEHIPDDAMAAFVANVARLVQPGGRLFVSVPTVNRPVHRKHHRHYSLPLLEENLKPHFQIESHRWLYRRGWLTRWMCRSLCNRLYVLNSKLLLGLIWRLHKARTYHANSTTGVHLVCVARPTGE